VFASAMNRTGLTFTLIGAIPSCRMLYTLAIILIAIGLVLIFWTSDKFAGKPD